MTPAKDALELKPCPFCGGPATLGGFPKGVIGQVYCKGEDCFGPKTTALTKQDSIAQWNKRATVTTPAPGRDAIELANDLKVAASKVSNWPENRCGGLPEGDLGRVFMDFLEVRNIARKMADSILSALPVAPDISDRGWHVTDWDRARSSGRILLVWRAFSGVREHVELGYYSDAKIAWVNTYGHPFSGDPDGWAPLFPFKTRSDIVERCAAIADAVAREADEQIEVNDAYYKRSGTRDTGANEACIHSRTVARNIASLIRSGGNSND